VWKQVQCSYYSSITMVVRILRQKSENFAPVTCKFCAIFVDSALILHTFASRFFHIKVFSGGSFDVACGCCGHCKHCWQTTWPSVSGGESRSRPLTSQAIPDQWVGSQPHHYGSYHILSSLACIVLTVFLRQWHLSRLFACTNLKLF